MVPLNLNKYVCITKHCKARHRVELQQKYFIYPKHILGGSIYPAGWQNRPRCLNLDHHENNGNAGDDSNDLQQHDTSLSYDNFLKALNPLVPTRVGTETSVSSWTHNAEVTTLLSSLLTGRPDHVKKTAVQNWVVTCKWPCSMSIGKFHIRTT